MLNNCEVIQFSDKFSKNSTLGHIILSEKKIEINSNAFKTNMNYEKMFETITHEIYHSMSAKRTEENRLYTGIQYFDEKGVKKGTVLNEVFNEVAADLASYNRTQIEFMSSKIPESEKQGFLQNFEKFEFQLETLKNLTDKKSSDLTEDDKKNIENAYIEISNFSFNTLYASMLNDNRPLTKEIQEEFEYRRDAVSNIVSNAYKRFSGKMLPDANNRISTNVNVTSRNRVNSLIVGLNHITRISDQISEEKKQQLIINIKTNYPQRKYKSSMQFEKNLLEKEGIAPIDVSKVTISQIRYPVDVSENSYRRKIRRENHDNFKQ